MIEVAINKTTNLLSKHLYLPKVVEVHQYLSEPCSLADFLSSINKRSDDYYPLATENIIQLIRSRTELEHSLRSFIKEGKKHSTIKGISSWFITLFNRKPLIIVTGSGDNEKFIKWKIHRIYKNRGEYRLEYLKDIMEFELSNDMFFAISKAATILDTNRIYPQVLGLYVNRLSENFPNLPIDMLQGIRMSKNIDLAATSTKYQQMFSKILSLKRGS